MKRRLAGMAAVVIAAAGLTAIAPQPATAVPGLIKVVAVSDYSDDYAQSAVASCPRGTRVLGGGAFIHGTTGTLTRLQALGNTDQFVAEAVTQYAGEWRIFVHAICGQGPDGLEYVGTNSGSNSNWYKWTSKSCPSGKKLISVGGRVTNGGTGVILDQIRPSADLKTVTTMAHEGTGDYTKSWNLWAFGVCAYPLPGLELVTDDTPVDSTDDTLQEPCPAGKEVHGVGARILGGSGEVNLQAIYPWAYLNGATVIAREGWGVTWNWYTTIYVICAT